VANAASLLADGIRRSGWWDLLSDAQKLRLQEDVFQIAETLCGVGGRGLHSSISQLNVSRDIRCIHASHPATSA
jgi:hypothetical protein